MAQGAGSPAEALRLVRLWGQAPGPDPLACRRLFEGPWLPLCAPNRRCQRFAGSYRTCPDQDHRRTVRRMHKPVQSPANSLCPRIPSRHRRTAARPKPRLSCRLKGEKDRSLGSFNSRISRNRGKYQQVLAQAVQSLCHDAQLCAAFYSRSRVMPREFWTVGAITPE